MAALLAHGTQRQLASMAPPTLSPTAFATVPSPSQYFITPPVSATARRWERRGS
jgi:hypothetical protein